ncbi:MAG: hypothetical protein KC464_28475, partial [Myxococcales bacterium]|nr:hypothetical protein [Myxococcales bacterium]
PPDQRPADPPPPPPPPPAEWTSTGWTMLGERVVNGRRDHDTIKVGAYEGRFDQIVLVVKDHDLELTKLKVTFGNGTKFEPEVRHTFREDSRTRVIDLPGNDRIIKKIDLTYRNLERRGRATVQVWGRDTRPPEPRFDPKGWDKLGEARVQGKNDRDTIKIGRDDGRFTKLTFAVEDGDIEVYDVVVTFGNGETFSPETRLTFREGSRTRAIDLPGDKRFIKKIDFHYGKLARRGKATVVVYGLPARNDKDDRRGDKDDRRGDKDDRWDDKDRDRGDRGDRHDDRDDRKDGGWNSQGWDLLGEQDVSGKNDRDVIKVGRKEGKFTKITMVVLDDDLELLDLEITFKHGKSFSPEVKQYFKQGSRTRVIDLPGDERVIKAIKVHYRNVGRSGQARVQFWGKH